MTKPSNGHAQAISPPQHWCWLAFYRDGSQWLEDIGATGEWQRALDATVEHGPVVALQIIPIGRYPLTLPSGATIEAISGPVVTVQVPAGATPVMRRRHTVDLNIVTGQQTRDAKQTIIGWADGDGGCYLHCWPNGEVLLTKSLNPEGN